MAQIASIAFRILFLLVIDLYAYQAFKAAFPEKTWVKWAYWGVHFAIYLATLIFTLWVMPSGKMPLKYTFWVFSGILTLYVPKLIVVLVLFLEDISRFVKWAYQMLSSKGAPIDGEGVKLSRAAFLSQSALFLGAIPMLGMLYGIIKLKYDYKVNRIKIPIKDLPDELAGFTLTQISDLHTGSYDNKAALEKGIDLVNAQNSDLIVFTGDLINFNISEVEGFEHIYSKLNAKEGVLAVLGNHDYYFNRHEQDDAEKEAHFTKVTQTHATYGWRLLRNEHKLIQKGDKSIAILGVENWSKSPYFPRKGRIDLAIKGAENANVKILLSHDPSHWDGEVRPTYADIDLTLSGHTHGFQFGIEIPGFKWSPAQWAYKQWAGLYQEGKQFLYVNRGFGFLGFSGRVGIRPEIAVFELVKA